MTHEESLAEVARIAAMPDGPNRTDASIVFWLGFVVEDTDECVVLAQAAHDGRLHYGDRPGGHGFLVEVIPVLAALSPILTRRDIRPVSIVGAK